MENTIMRCRPANAHSLAGKPETQQNLNLMKTKITKLLALISVVGLCCSRTNADLLVSGFDSGNVVRFDEASGSFIDQFIPYDSGGLTRAEGMAIGPDGRLYVANFGGGTVLRFDLSTGAFIDVFASGLSEPVGLIFKLGFLYVSEYAGSSVKRFDATTGAFIDVFVAAGSGGLNLAHGITFGPDGGLYVSSTVNAQVLRYDGLTGAFIDVFASGGGLSVPTNLILGPDGHLYVSSVVGGKVLRYDGGSGAFIDVFIPVTPDAHQVIFRNDGKAYVAGGTDVRRYDTASGAFVDIFATSSLLNRAPHMIFTSVGPPCMYAMQDLGTLPGDSKSLALDINNNG